MLTHTAPRTDSSQALLAGLARERAGTPQNGSNLHGPHRCTATPAVPAGQEQLLGLVEGLLHALTTALDARDPVTFGHSERVARMAMEIGSMLQLTQAELGTLYLAGLLHDVGKIGIRDAILAKPQELTQDEQEDMKRHVGIGYYILAGLKPIRHLLPAVLHHHERCDGMGYPEGLKREHIPLLARILSVADAYDAMSQSRPYRGSLPSEEVESILRRGAGTQWDAEVVEAFFRVREEPREQIATCPRQLLREAIVAVLQQDLCT